MTQNDFVIYSKWERFGALKSGREKLVEISSKRTVKDCCDLKAQNQSLFQDRQTHLSPEWEAVDYSRLAFFGFCDEDLIEIARAGAYSPERTQIAIQRFSRRLSRETQKNLKELKQCFRDFLKEMKEGSFKVRRPSCRRRIATKHENLYLFPERETAS
jgi:hypothetical protein